MQRRPGAVPAARALAYAVLFLCWLVYAAFVFYLKLFHRPPGGASGRQPRE